ncbi:MAG: DUF262 domain-containing protein [Treponema sp.]
MSDMTGMEGIAFDSEDLEPICESKAEEITKVISYNVANTVEVLIAKIDSNEVNLQPEFQRDFVWDINRSSLFIDSLLIGLPIPSIFLGKSKEDETYKVIDGQQRLKSVYFFIKGTFVSNKKEISFALKNLQGREWNNKTYLELDEKYKRRIRNSVLNTTVIESIDSNPKIVHDIFQRLNTGGMSLTDQEIRNCIYNGLFNQTLFELNENEDWRELLGKKIPDKRLADIELILRFYTLLNKYSSYHPSMREFLSDYQNKNKNEKPNTEIFTNTIRIIHEQIGNNAFRLTRNINKSVCDSVLISIALLISEGASLESLKERHQKLLSDEEFQKYVSAATSSENSVKGRIILAKNYFLGLK